MIESPEPDSREPETVALAAARSGDVNAIGPVLESYRGRLVRMVALRMDARLKGRFDASDVLQDAFVEASQRLPGYLDDASPMPFFLWVRFLVGQRLLQLHRAHLGVEARAADREVALAPPSAPGASPFMVASEWLGGSGTPSQVMAADEEHARVREALESMGEIDREVLVLRHFEELANRDVATLLGISSDAASARYVRALARLQNVVDRGGRG